MLAAGAMVKANIQTDGIDAAYAASQVLAVSSDQPVSIHCASNRQTVQIPLTLRVQASRAVILNASGGIIAIHSNTPRHDAQIHFLLGSLDGPKLAPSAGLLSQYLHLQPLIDWSKPGLVYQSP